MRLVDIKPDERAATAWSFLYFFSLLCGYYILRPMREAMGLVGGARDLPWLMTGTFAVMAAAVPIFAALVARVPRQRLLPWVYRFFLLNLLGFYALFQLGWAPVAVARTFYIWTSVYNLFVVTVFWSFMADVWRSDQGKRLFGVIAAGGSLGAILGPTLTIRLVEPLGTANLVLITAALLELAAQCIRRLGLRVPPEARQAGATPVGGGVLAAAAAVVRTPYLAAMAGAMLLATWAATFLYMQQGKLVEAAISDRGERTELFAIIDLSVNLISVLVQLLGFAPVAVARLGLGIALVFVPVVGLLGFGGLAAAPTLPVLVAFMIARRAGHYAIERPAREVLFTVVSREDKYKAKSFIDLFVYRGGDMTSGWVFAGLGALGVGLAGTAVAALPICLGGVGLGIFLARRHERIARAEAVTGATDADT